MKLINTAADMITAPFTIGAGLLLTAILAFQGFHGGVAQPAASAATANRECATFSAPFSSRNIEDIRVGERVVTTETPAAFNGIEHTNSEGVSGVDEEDLRHWNLVRMSAVTEWSDGTLDEVRIETLQPIEWLRRFAVSVGKTVPVPLDVVEMGLPDSLSGTVEAVLPAPNIRPGSGDIVLTTVSHLNNDLWRIEVADESGTATGCDTTGGHKFYCKSRCGWVSAADIRAGDVLDGVHGQLKVVLSAPVAGVQRVFNFTVAKKHVYRVTGLGILVHNMDCFRAVTQAELDDLKKTGQFQPMYGADGKYFFDTEQGAKMFGDADPQYGPGKYTIVGAEVPDTAKVYKDQDLDGYGPGTWVPKEELPNVEPKLP